MKIFRATTIILAIALVVSAILHIGLLASDSPEYRRWVHAQIGLHLVGVWLLRHIRKFRFSALVGLAVVSVLAAYINAVYVNYGNGLALWLVPLLFWCFYGGLAYLVRSHFGVEPSSHGT